MLSFTKYIYIFLTQPFLGLIDFMFSDLSRSVIAVGFNEFCLSNAKILESNVL